MTRRLLTPLLCLATLLPCIALAQDQLAEIGHNQRDVADIAGGARHRQAFLHPHARPLVVAALDQRARLAI